MSGERPKHEENSLAGQVAREIAEVTADLREILLWERSGGAVVWPGTPPDARHLPELVIVAPAGADGARPAAPPGGARSIPAVADAPRRAAPEAVRPSDPPTGATGPAARPTPPRTPPSGAALDATDLGALRTILGDCQRCKLSQERTNLVFGQGNPEAELLLVGEGPGYHEDQQGLAFVGPAGALLAKILGAIGRSLDDVYICNVVKCRPPQNRDPEEEEIAACRPFVERQIDLVKPRVILALGRIAGRALLGQPGASVASLRGRFHDYRGIPVMVTYHPAALLRDATYKRPTWDDVQRVRDRLDRP